MLQASEAVQDKYIYSIYVIMALWSYSHNNDFFMKALAHVKVIASHSSYLRNKEKTTKNPRTENPRNPQSS